jgi:hypothetical protein
MRDRRAFGFVQVVGQIIKSRNSRCPATIDCSSISTCRHVLEQVVVWKLCGQETQAQSSRDVCVRVVTGRRRHEQRKQAQEQGKLGSFCMVPQPQLRAGLERIWIVIGRSVDRATRLSSPPLLVPVWLGAHFGHCCAQLYHYCARFVKFPTTSNHLRR